MSAGSIAGRLLEVFKRRPTYRCRYELYAKDDHSCEEIVEHHFRTDLGQHRRIEDQPSSGLPPFDASASDILDFYRLRPFLGGTSPGSAKRDFVTTLIYNDDDEVRLKLVPQRKEFEERFRARYDHAELILDRRTWLPKALQIEDLNGAETVHVFHDLAVNGSIEPSQNSLVSRMR
jgi:hypothetical protein